MKSSTALPAPSDLPNDAATLLAGVIDHPTCFGRDFDPRGIIEGFKQNAANVIDYARYRWWQQTAVYWPFAIVDKVISELEAIERWKPLDSMLPEMSANAVTRIRQPRGHPRSREVLPQRRGVPIVKYLWYPAPFDHNDMGESQNVGNALMGKGGCWGLVRDYVPVTKDAAAMRRAIASAENGDEYPGRARLTRDSASDGSQRSKSLGEDVWQTDQDHGTVHVE